MFKNYFKIALRSLWNNRFYSLINICGLAIGLAASIIMLLWAQNELNFDHFHKDYQQIFRLSAHFKSGDEEISSAAVPGPLSTFARDISGVQSIVRINTSNYATLAIQNKEEIKKFEGNKIGYVDGQFFSLFSFPILQGDRHHFFPNPHSLVITESTAKKIFGHTNVMGKYLIFEKEGFTITGVIKDFPITSSILFDALLPMELYASKFTINGGNGQWKTIDQDMANLAFNTFLRLNHNADPSKVAQQFTEAYIKARDKDIGMKFSLQRLSDIHLVGPDGDSSALRLVQLFLVIVVILLTIASINYINLSTARSITRSKEVGIRKIVGANRRQLFLQFNIETLILFCIAIILAILILFLLRPLHTEFVGRELLFKDLNLSIWKVVILALTGTWLASSIYPAILLSSFKPLQAVKGKFTAGFSMPMLRKILVVFQFTISITLLICTLLVNKQISFMKNKDLGYDKSYVFVIPLENEGLKHVEAIKTALRTTAAVVSVGTSDAFDLAFSGNETADIYWPDKPEGTQMMINKISADRDFIPTMKIQFLEGDNFTGTPADSASYLLNETAVKQMGLKKPYVGQQITLHRTEGKIKGVIKDFNFQPLTQKVKPLIMFSFWQGDMLYVRTTAKNAQKAISAAEILHKKYGGDTPFYYTFIDKQIEYQLVSYRKVDKLFKIFAGIAIIISCLGLLGLATYTTQVRFREIGIRKVLGASVNGIVKLISSNFLKPVLLAMFIAIPLGWWAMDVWLQNFAYRTELSWWIFIIAGSLALSVALATVGFHAIKAAIANPVKSLRSE